MKGAAQVAHAQQQSVAQSSHGSPGGFVAVNTRPHHESNGNGASSSTRHELLSKFHTVSERRPSVQSTNGAMEAQRHSVAPSTPTHVATPVAGASKPLIKSTEPVPSSLSRPTLYSDAEIQHIANSPVPIPNTPSNLLPAASQRASQPQEKDDGGPYKVEMVQRMESLVKGERILPPCDRCRRLHMDCLKNLTACMGCTKKHAKCSWKEVREGELRGNYVHQIPIGGGMLSEGEDVDSRASTGSPSVAMSPPHRNRSPIASNTPTGQSHQQHPHYFHSEANIARRTSPHRIEREQDRGSEAGFQETAKAGLAHDNARLVPSEGQNHSADYQTMVA
jgi:hypothetical protein